MSSLWSRMRHKTIGRNVSCEGTGIMTGGKTKLVLKPADNEGIRFFRAHGQNLEPIEASSGSGSARNSSLGKGKRSVETVEHFMAAAYGLGVSSLIVEIHGSEFPILDGSAAPFVHLLKSAGIRELSSAQESHEVTEPLFVSKPAAALCILPQEGFRISYTLDYPRSGLEPMSFSILLDEKNFVDEISSARTFCLESEAEALRARGYGKGATTQNTLIIRSDGTPVDNRLRFKNECVRHKVLDLIGDLALTGFRLEGHVIGIRSGHELNRCLVDLIIRDRRNSREGMKQHVSRA